MKGRIHFIIVKVLVIKLGAIGDVILALPLLYQLKKEGAHVTWLAGPLVAPLLRATGLVDELLIADDKALVTGTSLQKAQVVFGVWWHLLGKHFDRVLVAYRDRRYQLLAKACRSGHVSALQREHSVHHALEYVRLWDPALNTVTYPELTLPCVEPLGEGRWIALAPGGVRESDEGKHLRSYPLAHYVTLTRLLLSKGWKVVLIGGKEDSYVLEAFEGLGVLSKIGTTTLLETIALYKQCAAVVTHDGGPMHLAYLSKRPVIALFGPTNAQHFASGPVLVGTASCAPCYNGKRFAPCAYQRCMAAIDPLDILKRVEDAASV